MYIKRFRRGYEAVPDPLHPARTVNRPILKPSAATSLVYRDPLTNERVELVPDAEGWFDVPHEVGNDLCRFRTPEGEGFYPEQDVAEERRLGRLEEEPREPARRGPGRPRKEERHPFSE